MLGLPKSTEFNKRIPKKKFYEQLEVTPEIKRVFVDQIKNIIWRNKIAPSTVNIATEFNKRIPKKKFYEQLEVTPEIKRVFVDQIKNIIWRNKIAPSTVNIAEGGKVTEIEVFEVQLTAQSLDEKILRQIDQGIPYPIVFVLHHEKQIQIWLAFKEAQNAVGSIYKVVTYYHTDWLPEDSYTLDLKGLTIDQVYENLVREIAGTELTHNEDIRIGYLKIHIL